MLWILSLKLWGVLLLETQYARQKSSILSTKLFHSIFLLPSLPPSINPFFCLFNLCHVKNAKRKEIWFKATENDKILSHEQEKKGRKWNFEASARWNGRNSEKISNFYVFSNAFLVLRCFLPPSPIFPPFCTRYSTSYSQWLHFQLNEASKEETQFNVEPAPNVCPIVSIKCETKRREKATSWTPSFYPFLPHKNLLQSYNVFTYEKFGNFSLPLFLSFPPFQFMCEIWDAFWHIYWEFREFSTCPYFTSFTRHHPLIAFPLPKD